MRIQWTVAAVVTGMTAIALGCGGYSAPSSPSAPQDSTADSTPPPSTPPPGYGQN